MGAADDVTRFGFGGLVPQLYQKHMVPLLFEPYAADMARRLAARPVTRVLEVAAGTGVLTRALASTLDEHVTITATDLDQSMLDHAASLGVQRSVEWRQANALDLPFPDASFDAVACQFGVMFLPDRQKAFSEARRVLKPGGVFIFSVWDRIEENEFADTANVALASMFLENPPRLLTRGPHSYYDTQAIAHDLAQAGFDTQPRFDTVTARSHSPNSQTAAFALCQGSPLRHEIEQRDSTRLQEATDAVAKALAERFGDANLDGKTQALVVTIER